MPGPLEEAAREFVSAVDGLDVDRVMATVADDAQSVDEISRRWLRGRDQVAAYLRELMGQVTSVKTELSDAHERIWGEVGALTCWMDQSYTLNGEPQSVSAPTTVLFQRQDGAWKVALFHSIPLPQEP